MDNCPHCGGLIQAKDWRILRFEEDQSSLQLDMQMKQFNLVLDQGALKAGMSTNDYIVSGLARSESRQ